LCTIARKTLPPFDINSKIILIGDSSVGKTSIFKKYKYKDKEFNIKSTVNLNFDVSYVNICTPTNRLVGRLNIWDTAGQERFRSMVRSYYHGTNCAIVVYDISNMTSFENSAIWIKDIKSIVDDNIYIILVGNKLDIKLKSDPTTIVTTELAESFAVNNGIDFIETSAIDGCNIDKLFETVALNMYIKGLYMKNEKIIVKPTNKNCSCLK